jgi:hypothetical protein
VNDLVVDEAGDMSKKAQHKFQEKLELTYEKLFRSSVEDAVELTKAFEHALGKDKALEIIKKWTEKSVTEAVKNQMAEKPIKSFEDFKRLRKEQEKSPSWTHMLTLTHPEETSKKLSYNITECLWAKVFKDLNATDLGYVLKCNHDFTMARAYHPKLRLKRTKTLMQGDSCCNHIYYWKE